MARNSHGATVTLRLANGELARLKELCEETGHGKSYLLRRAFVATLQERKAQPLAELALLERLDRAARRLEAAADALEKRVGTRAPGNRGAS